MTDRRCGCGVLASDHAGADLVCPGFREADPTDFVSFKENS